jgi:thiamine-monophosphate kinase
MTRETPLGPGAEFDAIRALLARWGDRAIGIGDDAASVRVPRGDTLVVSVDTAVEGRHFKREWLSMHDIGYRATVAALSDIAAMAAQPLGLLVALTLPEATRTNMDATIADLADAIGEAAQGAGAPILGGNLSSGNELSITTTVLGSAFAPLARSGAREGDWVYVTGRLGGPLTALRALELGHDVSSAHRSRFARPCARVREARWLADHGASAAIDVSDGLVADLRHLAAASAVSIAIDGGLVPRESGVALTTALESGEEYEIVVTTPEPFEAREFSRRFSLPLTRIGRVESRDAGAVHVRGVDVASISGHDHFSR